MLNVRRVPEPQWPVRTKLMQDAATNLGPADRFEPVELAVTFDKDWNYDLPNAHATARSKTFTNAQGRQQGTCVHLGNCDIGCDVAARNTLDLNYLALAERHGVEIRPLHVVTTIAPGARATASATTRSIQERSRRAPPPRASSSSPPDRWDQPSCCCVAAIIVAEGR